MSPGHPTPRAVQPLGGEAPPFLTWKPPFASLTSVSSDGGAEEKEACISCVWSVTGKTRRRNLTFPHGHVDSAAPHRREGEEKKKGKKKSSLRLSLSPPPLLRFFLRPIPPNPESGPPPPPPKQQRRRLAGGGRQGSGGERPPLFPFLRVRRPACCGLQLVSEPLLSRSSLVTVSYWICSCFCARFDGVRCRLPRSLAFTCLRIIYQKNLKNKT